MKLYTFRTAGAEHIGAERDGKLVELDRIAPTMLAFIQGGETALSAAHNLLSANHTPVHEFPNVRLRAPLPRPGKMLCSGLNYKSHIQENPAAVLPDEPDVFVKVSSAIIGPGEPIVLPAMSTQVDYEVEFAVVIGRALKHTPPAQIMEHLFGYTIVHDVSARDVQFKPNGRARGKNFDTFAPMGPCLVTKEELPDPPQVRLCSYLNGQLMQEGNTSDWLFPLPTFLSYLSSIMTLEPGDILTTGTPAGVGFFRKPQVFLKPGDVCRLEIEGIGVLENPVIAYDTTPEEK